MQGLITGQRLYKCFVLSILALLLLIPSSACIKTTSFTDNTETTSSHPNNTPLLSSPNSPSLTLISTPDGVTGSIGSAGYPGYPTAFNRPQINDLGQVCFASTASNLTGSLSSGFEQQYLWNAQDGLKFIINQNVLTPDANNELFPSIVMPSISQLQINNNGQMAFCSNSSNLPGANGFYQIYYWDKEDGIILVFSPDGETGASGPFVSINDPVGSIHPKMNDEGQIVFESNAKNLPGSDVEGAIQLYFWDRNSGVSLISTADGITGAKNSEYGYSVYYGYEINDAGQVVFDTVTENLCTGGNYYAQIYYWDLENGLTLVSSPDGFSGGSGFSTNPQINNAGQIVFMSDVADFPNASSDGSFQIYLWSMQDGFRLISAIDGLCSGISRFPQINDSGQVVFASNVSNLPGTSKDGSFQIYLWDYEQGTILISSPDSVVCGNGGDSRIAQINDSGQIIFESQAINLPNASLNGSRSLYFWDPEDGISLVAHGLVFGDYSAQINNHGQIVFESNAHIYLELMGFIKFISGVHNDFCGSK